MGFDGVAVGQRTFTLRRFRIRLLRLNHVKRARRLPASDRIDKDSGVVAAVAQRVGEIHRTNPEIDHMYAFRPRTAHRGLGDFDPEGVVAAKNIADARDENAPDHACSAALSASGSTSSGAK